MLKIVNESVSFDLYKALNNAKATKLFNSGAEKKSYIISHLGEGRAKSLERISNE